MTKATKQDPVRLSVYIIAYNEAEKIGPAIESVGWADEIIVVDSYSQDATADIAASKGARVVQIPFRGFGALRNEAMKTCTHGWIFSLDADERCTTEVQKEILKIIKDEDALDAYYVPRRNLFMGECIKYSGFFPDYRQPQLFRKGILLFKPDLVHEGYVLQSSKPAGYLQNGIWQIPYANFEELLQKANRYSSLGALKLEENGKNATMAKALFHGVWAFVQLFFLKLGFLDGWPGFVIALGNFEGTFYKYAKLTEKKSVWRYNPFNT